MYRVHLGGNLAFSSVSLIKSQVKWSYAFFNVNFYRQIPFFFFLSFPYVINGLLGNNDIIHNLVTKEKVGLVKVEQIPNHNF